MFKLENFSQGNWCTWLFAFNPQLLHVISIQAWPEIFVGYRLPQRRTKSITGLTELKLMNTHQSLNLQLDLELFM